MKMREKLIPCGELRIHVFHYETMLGLPYKSPLGFTQKQKVKGILNT